MTNSGIAHQLLRVSVVLAAALTAMCPLYFAQSLIRLYLGIGQLLIAALSLAKGALYMRLRTLRRPCCTGSCLDCVRC